MVQINKRIKQVAFVFLVIDEARPIFSSLSDNSNIRFKNKLGIRPKLGLEYLCAALKGRNIESKIYDQELINFSPQELITFFQKDNIDLIGFQVVSRNIKSTIYFIQEIRKNSSIPIIVGGAGCYHYNELLRGGCDIVCLGEGDETIIDIVNYYEGKTCLESIKGIAYYKIKIQDIKITPARPLIDNLNRLPFPLRTPESMKSYFDYLVYPAKRPCLTMITSRGCLYHCSYCYSHSFWAGTYRQRSVENVIEEIRQAVDKFNIKSIQFIDDLFAADFNWLREFCEKFENENFNLKWMCYIHPMSFKEKRKEAFSMMKKAGCEMISFGAQSSNGGILKKINRDPDETQELRKAISQAKSLKITTVICYIFGLPGETADTIHGNFDFCSQTKPHLVFFNPLDLIPFCDLALKYKGKEKEMAMLNQKEIACLSTKYTRKYYFLPKVVFQILNDILDKNPARLFTFIKKIFYFWEKMSYLN